MSESLPEGTKIEARYRGKRRWFKGIIVSKNENNTYRVKYDDGDRENAVKRKHIRVLEGASGARVSNVDDNHASAEDYVKSVFDVCDKDKDGFLNHKELSSWSVAVGDDALDKDNFMQLCESLACDGNQGLTLAAMRNIYEDPDYASKTAEHLRLLQASEGEGDARRNGAEVDGFLEYT